MGCFDFGCNVSGSSTGNGLEVTNTATSVNGYGIRATISSQAGVAVTGFSTSPTGNATGILGDTSSDHGAGIGGVHSATSGDGIGVVGVSLSSTGIGIYGECNGSGLTVGVEGVVDSREGTAVLGQSFAESGKTIGVDGRNRSMNGIGVRGLCTPAFSDPNHYTFGVWGETHARTGFGVYGISNAGQGVCGISDTGTAVTALAESLSGTNYALYASTFSQAGYAGFFDGQVYTTRDLMVGGDLSVAGIKGFIIDHPLDPSNKYLHHAAIESSEILNLYSGNIELDENGEAWVVLPAWFEALNSDIRYQLTAIGAPNPNIHVAHKVQQNRFKIAGGRSRSEVSWQVTGVRHDPHLKRHPMSVESTKPADEQGTYLHPDAYGQPEDKSVAAVHRFRRPPTLPMSHVPSRSSNAWVKARYKR